MRISKSALKLSLIYSLQKSQCERRNVKKLFFPREPRKNNTQKPSHGILHLLPIYPEVCK